MCMIRGWTEKHRSFIKEKRNLPKKKQKEMLIWMSDFCVVEKKHNKNQQSNFQCNGFHAYIVVIDSSTPSLKWNVPYKLRKTKWAHKRRTKTHEKGTEWKRTRCYTRERTTYKSYQTIVHSLFNGKSRQHVKCSFHRSAFIVRWEAKTFLLHRAYIFQSIAERCMRKATHMHTHAHSLTPLMHTCVQNFSKTHVKQVVKPRKKEENIPLPWSTLNSLIEW